MHSKKIALLFSHKLTKEQEEDIKNTLEVKTNLSLPEELQLQWSQVPTDKELVMEKYLLDIKTFLLKNLKKDDFVLVAGDAGATYHIVNFCKKEGFVPIYSTTKRTSKEKMENGKVVKFLVFEHHFFREYL